MFGKKQSTNQLGVSMTKQGIAYCHITEQNIQDAQRLNLVDGDFTKTLNVLNSSLGLSGDCQLILAPTQYHIVQIDRPNVSEEEMNQALKWQVKELVNIAPDDMIVDYFDGPQLPGGLQKLNVVCASKKELAGYVNELLQNGIEISAISTEEFAFANLLPVQDDAHLLLVQQPDEELIILIVKHGQIFFHRRLRGFSDIAKKSQDELSFGVVDSISLEIQRSTDYFERQLKQAPIKTIKVLIPNDNESYIARKLSENTNVAVELFEMPEAYKDYREYAVTLGLLSQHPAKAPQEQDEVV
jgi:MSHA biogenesis protein MshI